MIAAAALALFLKSGITDVDMQDEYRFCRSHRAAVVCHGHPGQRLDYDEVLKVDARLRARFRYQGDPELSNTTFRGNCQDYVWHLAEDLARAGEAGSYMTEVSLIVCDDKGCDGHDTLLVDTDRGVVEVDVTDPPGPIMTTDSVWFGMMRMDGRKRVVPLPGFHLSKGGDLEKDGS